MAKPNKIPSPAKSKATESKAPKAAPKVAPASTTEIPAHLRAGLTKEERKALSPEQRKERRAHYAAKRGPAHVRIGKQLAALTRRLGRLALRIEGAKGTELVKISEALSGISITEDDKFTSVRGSATTVSWSQGDIVQLKPKLGELLDVEEGTELTVVKTVGKKILVSNEGQKFFVGARDLLPA